MAKRFASDSTALGKLKTNLDSYTASIPPTTTSSFTFDSVTYSPYLYFTVFSGNTYTSNYASNGGGVLSISGAYMVIVDSETLTNNGDMFDEKISEISLPITAEGTNLYSSLFSTNNYGNGMKVKSLS